MVSKVNPSLWSGFKTFLGVFNSKTYPEGGFKFKPSLYGDILWNKTLVLLEDKFSSTTVDFIRSEGKLKTKHLY